MLAAFAAVGLASMAYLYLGFGLGINAISNSCTIYSTPFDCGNVVTSQHSTFLGIDWYYYGIAFFSAILAATVAFWLSDIKRTKERILYAIVAVSGAGAFVAAYLIYTELFRIHYICEFCTVGHASIFIIFAASLLLAEKTRHHRE